MWCSLMQTNFNPQLSVQIIKKSERIKLKSILKLFKGNKPINGTVIIKISIVRANQCIINIVNRYLPQSNIPRRTQKEIGWSSCNRLLG